MRSPWGMMLSILAFAAVVGCDQSAGGSSDQGNAVAGGSSDQGNAIQVRVLDTAGLPMVGARVMVLPRDWKGAADICLADSGCGFVLTSDSTGTAKGYVDSGRYAVTVEAAWYGSYREVVVDSTRPVELSVRPDAHVRLSGTVPSLASDSLFVPGTDRVIRFDAAGRFLSDSLPCGVKRLASKDGRGFLVDSLDPGTIGYFGSLPAQGAAPARPDSVRYLPPVLVPVQGDGVNSPWRVAVHPRVGGTSVEWSRDSGNAWGGWTPKRGDLYVDSVRQFWFRARKIGFREGVHRRFDFPARVPVGRAALPMDTRRPVDRLQSWRPDSVWLARDTLWIWSRANSCHSLPWHGVSGWRFEDTLHVFRRECPDTLGGEVRILLNVPSPRGVWYVSTLQPQGYVWEIP